jgi:hypothetical protein
MRQQCGKMADSGTLLPARRRSNGRTCASGTIEFGLALIGTGA